MAKNDPFEQKNKDANNFFQICFIGGSQTTRKSIIHIIEWSASIPGRIFISITKMFKRLIKNNGFNLTHIR